MTASLSPVVFDAPLVNPSPTGLFGAVSWIDEDAPLRWLGAGVDIRVFNYGGEHAYGVWQADPFAVTAELDPDDVKGPGLRPEWPDTFEHFTSWAADDCDLTQGSQAEVQLRAQQVLRLQEQNAVEEVFAVRLLDDTTPAVSVDDIVDGVAVLEGALAQTGTLGVIHAPADFAAHASIIGLIRYNGTKMVSPLGHQWVFGGGYMHGLGDTMVATSPLFGWRGPVTVGTTIKSELNRFYAIAERSLLVGYEAAVGAVSVAGS